jgi:hypothetical protein
MENLPVLTITATAGAYLTEMLNDVEAWEGIVMRIALEAEGLIIEEDLPRPGDAQFDYAGRTVLVLDDQLAQAFADYTLDVEDTEDGPALTLL